MDYIEKVLPDMKSAAGRVARKWPNVTSEEDLFQDLVVHFLERQGSLEKISELEADHRTSVLTNIGHQLASKARDDLSVFSGQFAYSVNEVRSLLNRGALTSEHDKFSADVEDMLQGMNTLKAKTPAYHAVLIDRYVHGVRLENGTAEYKRLTRAVDSLTNHMNRIRRAAQYEYLNGGRQRVSIGNREAVAIGDYHYQGDSDWDGYKSDLDVDRAEDEDD